MSSFICPHCQTPLQKNNNQLRCENGHCFDIGKAGDVNLLLPNQKRSKSPGDSKEMINARRDFLNSGVYQRIADELAQSVAEFTKATHRTHVVADAGCGEGYYLRQVYQYQLADETIQPSHFIGWDISKFAVQSASKQARAINMPSHWSCASNAAIPLASESVDTLICGFGFAVADEFARVLRSGNEENAAGHLITLDAGENHLIELRRVIYDEIKPYSEKPGIVHTQLTKISQSNFTYEITLDKQQIAQLMCMTPHLYRTKASGKQRLAELDSITLTIDVIKRIYKKD